MADEDRGSVYVFPPEKIVFAEDDWCNSPTSGDQQHYRLPEPSTRNLYASTTISTLESFSHSAGHDWDDQPGLEHDGTNKDWWPLPKNNYSDLPISVNSEFDLFPEPVLQPYSYHQQHGQLSVSELQVENAATTDHRKTPTSSLRPASKLSKLLVPFRLRSRRLQSDPAATPPLPPLPRLLSFCFSAAGTALLLWKRNDNVILHVNIQSRQTRRLNLADVVPPTESTKTVAIRLVAAGHSWASIVVLHKKRHHLLFLPLDEAAQSSNQQAQAQSPPQPLHDGFHPARIAMSYTDTVVALSSGRHGFVYICSAGVVLRQERIVLWPPPAPKSDTAERKKHEQKEEGGVQYQALGFCERGDQLVVATQDASDVVDIRAWKCSDTVLPEIGGMDSVGERLGSTRITTGYGDYRGVTAILCSTVHRTAFIAGFSGKSYPNIIHFPHVASPHSMENNVNSAKAEYLKQIKSTQIPCATSSPSGNLIAFLDSRNVLSLVDLRSSASVQLLGDIVRERRGADHNEEDAVIAMPCEDQVYVFCIRRSQPVLVTFVVGASKEVLDSRQISIAAAKL